MSGPRARGGRAGIAAAVLLCAGLAGCGGGPRPETRPVEIGWTQEGVASWYGGKFHGRATASGERYDQEGMTAAHRTLPFGTWIRVDNLDNGRRIRVRVTDRGPFVGDRILDLSRAAARELGMIGPGTARVRIVVFRTASEAGCREVQVAALREERNLRAVADSLRTAGAPVRLEPGGDGTTRVVLGPYPDDRSARRARATYGGFIRPCEPTP